MKFATTSIGLISAFIIQMQPTIQELIKNDALNQISISCEGKSVNIQGENKIEDAIKILKELECDSDTRHR